MKRGSAAILPDVTDDQPTLGSMRERVQEAVSWTRNERFEEAIEVFEDCLPTLSSDGDLQDKRFAAAAFSYYGLCVAMDATATS